MEHKFNILALRTAKSLALKTAEPYLVKFANGEPVDVKKCLSIIYKNSSIDSRLRTYFENAVINEALNSIED